jgi:hypothetical protein
VGDTNSARHKQYNISCTITAKFDGAKEGIGQYNARIAARYRELMSTEDGKEMIRKIHQDVQQAAQSANLAAQQKKARAKKIIKILKSKVQ